MVLWGRLQGGRLQAIKTGRNLAESSTSVATSHPAEISKILIGSQSDGLSPSRRGRGCSHTSCAASDGAAILMRRFEDTVRLRRIMVLWGRLQGVGFRRRAALPTLELRQASQPEASRGQQLAVNDGNHTVEGLPF